ncbi:SDR family oxidoreductase [Microlunatus sp. GCM10028923]|uniref:SDR family oxidoreductase n=1 Tax=Microlunatus sp. GCM10028923 TaxID=3273400 RepID=UPI00360FA4DA
MRIFVTGATGWIGSAVVPELIKAGHEVVGLARSDRSADALKAAGAEALRGDLTDPASLRAGAADADGVIQLAFDHSDFGAGFAEAIRQEARSVEVFGEALAGTGKALVVASGTPALTGQVSTEADWQSGPGLAEGRELAARAAVGLAEQGVRPSVVRLPRSVHGTGDHGFVAQLIAVARAKGVSGYLGDGTNRWPAVHVTDAARLFRLAAEQAPAGSVLHAIGDEGVRLGDLAAVIGRHLDLPVGRLETADYGPLGPIFERDQPSSAEQTRRLLNWTPTGPDLLADVDQGHYFEANGN